jgi:hypothetical protein
MRDALDAYLRFAAADSVKWASHLDQQRSLLGRHR